MEKRTLAMKKWLNLNNKGSLFKDNLARNNLARNKKGGYNKNLR